jgi:hypothetical protein
LQISHEWSSGHGNRPQRRQVQEIATGNLHLGAEEMVIRRQNDRRREGDDDIDFFTGR